MKIFRLKTLVVVIVLSVMGILQSCSNHDDLDNYVPTAFNVAGKVEKGPFVRGTSIQMQPLDADLDETGQSYTSSITDNEGTFSFGSKTLQSPYVKLSASGYYFNEVTGRLSSGTLALNAIANLEDAQTVNVNILSHLKYQRVLRLVDKQGMSFKEANKQAQQEVLAAFGLQKYAQTDVNRFSITAGTDEAAALIAVSSLVQYDRTEAQVTEYLSVLSEDFANNGSFSDEIKQQIRKDMFGLEGLLSSIADNIESRYEELGKNVLVKELIYFFDWDGDGVAGNEIPTADNPISLSQTEIFVPKEGGTYEVKVNATVPVFVERPDIPDDDEHVPSVNPSYMGGLYADGSYTAPSISCTKELNNGILKVTVGKASSKTESSTTIRLYNALGNEVAWLHVTQEGDPNVKVEVPRLGDEGEKFFNGTLLELSQALTLNQSLVNRYTKLIEDSRFVAPISSYNTNICNLWQYNYSSLNYIAQMYRIDADQRAVYAPFLNVYRDLCYYNMVTLWGGVVVMPNAGWNSIGESYPKTSETDVLSMLESELSDAIGELDEKRNAALASDANAALFLSRDVARVLLAKVYMYQQKWKKANDLLQAVVSKGLYSIEKVPTNYTANSKDLIWGLYEYDGTRSRSTKDVAVPIFTMTDAALLYAECQIYLGNQSAASKYISEVGKVNGLSVPATSIAGINWLRKSLKLQDYFAFLKRNGLAMSELGLEKYQLLLPIPASQCDFNPSLTQNPGY